MRVAGYARWLHLTLDLARARRALAWQRRSHAPAHRIRALEIKIELLTADLRQLEHASIARRT